MHFSEPASQWQYQLQSSLTVIIAHRAHIHIEINFKLKFFSITTTERLALT